MTLATPKKSPTLLAGEVELQRVEGADVDAELAAGADAVVLDDDGLGPLAAGEGAADVAQVVEDGLGRADDATGAAVDAEVGVDDVDLVADAGDRFGRAALGAGRTADAGLDDFITQYFASRPQRSYRRPMALSKRSI